jgi:hypothetical protein
MGGDSLAVSFLLAIHTEGRRALVTPEPRQQGDDDTSAKNGGLVALEHMGQMQRIWPCYEICVTAEA